MPSKQQHPIALLNSVHADPNYDHNNGQPPLSGPNKSSMEQPSQSTKSLVSGGQSGSLLSDCAPFSGFQSNPQAQSLGFAPNAQVSSPGLTPNPQTETQPTQRGRRREIQRPQDIPSLGTSRKRRAPSEERPKLSILPPLEVFQAMSTAEKSEVTTAVYKRRKMADELARKSTQSAQQPSRSTAGVVGPKVTPKMRSSFGQPGGGLPAPPRRPKIEPLGVDPLEAFRAKLTARTRVSGAVHPSSSLFTTSHTLEATSSSPKSFEEAAILDTPKVDSHEGNALIRWVWEELSKDLQHSRFVAVDSYKWTETSLLQFTSAALKQMFALKEIVNLTADMRARLAEIHTILERHQHQHHLTDDMRQQLSEVFSGVNPATHFEVRSLFAEFEDVRSQMNPDRRQSQCILRADEIQKRLQKIYNTTEASEKSFANSYNKVLEVYSQRYSSHELYGATVRRFRYLAECIGAVIESNVLIAIKRLQEMDKKVCGLGQNYPRLHNFLSIAEQFYDGRLSEVRTIMRCLFSKIINAIFPFHLFEIDGDTQYQFLHGTAKRMGLYSDGRRFWSIVILELRSMLQPEDISDDDISDMLSQYMVGKARISPLAAPKMPTDAKIREAPSSPVQLHTKPFPPDPSDIEGTGALVRFAALTIAEPVILEVCPEEPSPTKEVHATSGDLPGNAPQASGGSQVGPK